VARRHPGVRIRRLRTDELTGHEIEAIRRLLWDTFEASGDGFAEQDWDHSVGGLHVVLDLDGAIAAHASVVERMLHIGDAPVRTGYVEAVATAPEHQGRRFGSAVMTEIGDAVRGGFELGALATGAHSFYERLGWLRWEGPTWVRTPAGPVRTEDADDALLVLPTPAMPAPDRSLPISCDWRAGDVW
jgi:aminoglycoside 2'-N-acetyltransferase I